MFTSTSTQQRQSLQLRYSLYNPMSSTDEMVYKCIVADCKSHDLPKNTTFGIPRDPDLRRKWEEALRPYSKGKTLQDNHRVCKAHFNPEEMEFYFVHLIQGTEVKIERGRPELKKGAIPSVFPGSRKSAWRRVLERKQKEAENAKQSILLRNGEWVHLKKPKNPVEPKKSNKRTKTKSSTAANSSTAAKHLSGGSESVKQQNCFENLSDSGFIKLQEPVEDDIGREMLSVPAFRPMKPSEKEMPSICINWDALPLPEEIGALLCDTVVPPLSSSTDLNFNPHVSHSPQRPLSPKALSPKIELSPIQEDFLTGQPSQESPSISGDIADNQQQEEENFVLSFQGLLFRISDVQLPSPMWASHTDRIRIFFSCMSFGSIGCAAVPKVEKVVMYQGFMQPRVFLRGTEVSLPYWERKSVSLEDVEEVLFFVDKLKLCLGIDCGGDIVTYTTDCDIYVESGRLPRCQSCKKQRTIEYNKKRHLENDSCTSLCQPVKKRQF